MKRKFALLLGAGLLVCAWHACVYDRATWYGEAERGKKMADGRRFDPDAMTAASWDYPLGTMLEVSFHGRSVQVEVTDRGGTPAFGQIGKTVDLSKAAFARLEKPAAGSIHVQIKRLY